MENAIMTHQAVIDAAVVGVPHPKWQERPVAVVVADADTGLTGDEVRAHLAPLFAKWQLPEKVIFVDEVPRTGTGKQDKKQLRARYSDVYQSADQ